MVRDKFINMVCSEGISKSNSFCAGDGFCWSFCWAYIHGWHHVIAIFFWNPLLWFERWGAYLVEENICDLAGSTKAFRTFVLNEFGCGQGFPWRGENLEMTKLLRNVTNPEDCRPSHLQNSVAKAWFAAYSSIWLVEKVPRRVIPFTPVTVFVQIWAGPICSFGTT